MDERIGAIRRYLQANKARSKNEGKRYEVSQLHAIDFVAKERKGYSAGGEGRDLIFPSFKAFTVLRPSSAKEP